MKLYRINTTYSIYDCYIAAESFEEAEQKYNKAYINPSDIKSIDIVSYNLII